MFPISRDQRELLLDIYERDQRSRVMNDLPALPSYREWRKNHCGRNGMFCVISNILTFGQKLAQEKNS